MALQKFVVTHHTKLVSMTRAKVAKRGKHVAEFHTLNRCLDNAIAAAVTTWTGSTGRVLGQSLEKMRALLDTASSG